MADLKYVNHPVEIDSFLYNEACEYFKNYLSSSKGFKSFYRFGNITTPGISDLDLLVVFENNVECLINSFDHMPAKYEPLFTHRIMAVSEDHFYKNHHYTLWSEYFLIAGEDIAINLKEKKSEEEITALKIQTALEFLIANYIDIKIQLTYKSINLRSFLQHMKGIIYDLEFLGIFSGNVYSLLKELKNWILNWFKVVPAEKQITEWIREFDKEFELFCNAVFSESPLYLPPMSNYPISRNATLSNAKTIHYRHKGVVLPAYLSRFGKKITRLQNRFNYFEFYVPITNSPSNVLLIDRFNFLREMKAYNRRFLPNFMTLTTSITSKII